MTAENFAASWAEWHDRRVQEARAPYGPASLAATHWLTGSERRLEGLPGSWAAHENAVLGSGAAGRGLTYGDGRPAVAEDGRLTLAPGEGVFDGARLLRAFARDGQRALRIFDPQTARNAAIKDIDAYAPDSAWAFEARFEPGFEEVETRLVDGYTRLGTMSGTAVFVVGGTEHRLLLSPSGTDYSTIFADETSGVETYRFRFLHIPAPRRDGKTVVDFNRAFLPPCAFSEHFVCPLPPASNRLALAVTAGEKAIVRAPAAVRVGI